MRKGMRKMMFGYKIKAMHKGTREMMFGHKVKVILKGCVSYAQENAQVDVNWVKTHIKWLNTT